jgi:hypothetical protein
MLNETAIAALKSELRGELIEPSDTRYDAMRKVYNSMIDRRPRLIARCPRTRTGTPSPSPYVGKTTSMTRALPRTRRWSAVARSGSATMPRTNGCSRSCRRR